MIRRSTSGPIQIGAPTIGASIISIDGEVWKIGGSPAALIHENIDYSIMTDIAWNWFIKSMENLTENHQIVLEASGAEAGDVMSFFFSPSVDGGFVYELVNGPDESTLYTPPNTGARVVDCQFNGVNWIKNGQKGWVIG